MKHDAGLQNPESHPPNETLPAAKGSSANVESGKLSAGFALARRALDGARRLALPLFCLQFVVIDLALRQARVLHHWSASPSAAFAVIHSVMLWLALGLLGRGAAWRRALVGLLAGFTVAFQTIFFARFSRFVDRHVARSALAAWGDVGPAFVAELPRFIAIGLAVAFLETLWLGWAEGAWPEPGHSARNALRRMAKGPARFVVVAGALLLVLVPFSATAKGPPDLRLLDMVTVLPFAPPEKVAVAATSLPPMPAPRTTIPNVVLVVTESVRSDEYCSAPVPDCPTAPEINALFPERIGLPQMRSLASFTVVSLSTLVTGRAQNIPRAELLRSPTIFDAAKALSVNGKSPYTAYWSAHHSPMFHWDDPKRSIDSYVTFETLFSQEGKSTRADVRLSEMFQARLAKLPSPFFVVLHFHDTHILYGFDEKKAPFQPWSREVSWKTMPELKNAYRNAIHGQDRSIAAALRALTSDPRWPSTFVLFTSDHGEAFGEHKAIHHGQNVLDEQVHVPGWIAFGDRAISPDEKAALRRNADAFITHLDVTPTLLDLYGLWQAPEMLPHVAKMPGRSLLRPFRGEPRPAPMTNCSETFACPFNNWGILQGNYKLEAQGWDSDWTCWVIGPNGETKADPDDSACEALENASQEEFPDLPNGSPND